MKITTWNVNGIRAVLNKGAWDWVAATAPDVMCVQEIKAQPEKPKQFTPKHFEILSTHEWSWHPAERPGYSGVGTGLAGAGLGAKMTAGFGHPDFDSEGRVIQSDHGDFILFNIYFPNGSRDHSRVGYKLDFYDKLLVYCEALHAAGRNIIITGDFNTAHNEIDLANPKSNQNTTGFMPIERYWLDKYLEHGFVDAWRQLYPERVQYTWWHVVSNARARNVGWRLDFFFVSEALMPRVEDVIIHDEVMGSDHCPVSLILK